jgi:hypothetical protein
MHQVNLIHSTGERWCDPGRGYGAKGAQEGPREGPTGGVRRPDRVPGRAQRPWSPGAREGPVAQEGLGGPRALAIASVVRMAPRGVLIGQRRSKTRGSPNP